MQVSAACICVRRRRPVDARRPRREGGLSDFAERAASEALVNIACEFAVKQEPFVNMWATAAQRLYNDIEIGRDVNHKKGEYKI